MLHVEDLTVAYGDHVVLDGTHLRVESGGIAAITGESGSGKSTLLNVVGLLERPTSGSVTFDGEDLLTMSGRRAAKFRRDRLGYLFQDYALIENATISDNLAVVSPGFRTSRSQRLRFEEALADVGLAKSLDTKIVQLSGGERQRVAIARLLIKRPRLVLADEPTGALDAANEELVLELIRGLATEGAAVVLATHSPRVVEACDVEVCLSKAPVLV